MTQERKKGRILVAEKNRWQHWKQLPSSSCRAILTNNSSALQVAEAVLLHYSNILAHIRSGILRCLVKPKENKNKNKNNKSITNTVGRQTKKPFGVTVSRWIIWYQWNFLWWQTPPMSWNYNRDLVNFYSKHCTVLYYCVLEAVLIHQSFRKKWKHKKTYIDVFMIETLS